MKSPVVLVIRRDDQFSALLRDSGCEVLNLELIRTEPAENLSELDARLAWIDEYDGLFFTSPVAAEVFVKQSNKAGSKFTGKAYVLGERAGKILENSGLEVVYRSSANTVEELIGYFDEAEFVGKKFLFVRGDRSLRTIPQLLAAKARIDEAVVYQTRENRSSETVLESIREQLRKGAIDWVCFFSPSGVESFRKLFATGLTRNAKVAVIGKTTARKAEELHLNAHFVSQRANAEDFAVEFIEQIKNID